MSRVETPLSVPVRTDTEARTQALLEAFEERILVIMTQVRSSKDFILFIH